MQVNQYFKRLVEVESMYFIENKKCFSEYISSDKYDTSKYNTSKYKSVYLNHRMLLMNPKSTLNFDERRMTFQSLQSYLYEYFLKNDKYFKWMAKILDKKIKRGNIHKLIDEFSEVIFKHIIKQINKNRICIELVCIKQEQYNEQHTDDLDVDILWMTESIHKKQPIYVI
ncbi:hypothetical protein [Macrococcoides bohemicum]|nr:hypothetical protein [Macrococcus bohemicus]